VLTGGSKLEDIAASPFKPDYVIENLDELVPAGYEARRGA
jgi:ribonucleotide monophosphatase NagD (HAD superfamily)